jgi:hypothetical protein
VGRRLSFGVARFVSASSSQWALLQRMLLRMQPMLQMLHLLRMLLHQYLHPLLLLLLHPPLLRMLRMLRGVDARGSWSLAASHNALAEESRGVVSRVDGPQHVPSPSPDERFRDAFNAESRFGLLAAHPQP